MSQSGLRGWRRLVGRVCAHVVTIRSYMDVRVALKPSA